MSWVSQFIKEPFLRFSLKFKKTGHTEPPKEEKEEKKEKKYVDPWHPQRGKDMNDIIARWRKHERKKK